jgi:hypothetical protein
MKTTKRNLLFPLLVALLLLLSSIIPVFATPMGNSDSCPAFQAVFDELALLYANDYMFNRELASRGLSMEELLVEKTIAFLHNQALMDASIRSRNIAGNIRWANVPLIQQHRNNTCGPASALQALHALNRHTSVSGRTDYERMSTLASEMFMQGFINSSHPRYPGATSAYVYRMTRSLNAHSPTFQYRHIAGYSMTIDQLRHQLATSLSFGVAPIIHARTEHLSYYNGRASGHYIAVSAINLATDMVTLSDCNWRAAYHGVFTVPLTEVHASIQRHRGYSRYLLVMTGIPLN